ncbi:hypothetical protein [uncultured Oscillibacter sp.]|uniref:hypothetical protein n=1 Tax=uncultured Oscillibacter sp. TaxID=876091 RepID=UPI0025D7AF5E|nr:hypothetical protein [uncultured Oscillibacter sp.]
MDNSELIMKILMLIMAIVWLLIIIGIPIAIFFAIKHLIKFTTRTIYEEKARAEERHRKSYDPEEDR